MNFDAIGSFWDKHYKKLMIITIILLIASIGILGASKINTGEFLQKDFTLKGGLLITIQINPTLSLDDLKTSLSNEINEDVNVRELRSLSSGESSGYIIEFESLNQDSALAAIEKTLDIKLQDNYTIEEVSSQLGESFLQSAIKAIIVAFIIMSIVVFIYFREFIPSVAVLLAGFSNLIETIAIMNILDIKLSTAAIAALLMIIGYSVDTDILLSTKVLKRTDLPLKERLYSSFKTGLTMQITAIIALAVLYALTPALLLKQIALILIIGLFFDMLNTWIQNAGILRLYLENKGGKQ
ncbi:MAG: protein translocase subunit SecF [Nanoarchaeota archaeon]